MGGNVLRLILRSLLTFLISSSFVTPAFSALQVNPDDIVTIGESEIETGQSQEPDENGQMQEYYYGLEFIVRGGTSHGNSVGNFDSISITGNNENSGNNLYGVKVGTNEANTDTTDITLTGTKLDISFSNIKGDNYIYGLYLSNASQSEEILENKIDIDTINIDISDTITADYDVIGIRVQNSQSSTGQQSSTHNTITGNTLSINVSNNAVYQSGAERGSRAIGISSQTAENITTLSFIDSINIEATATNGSEAYGIMMDKIANATDYAHKMQVFAKDIVINAIADESQISEDSTFSKAYGVAVYTPRSSYTGEFKGNVFLNIGLEKDFSSNDYASIPEIDMNNIADNVAIISSGVGVLAEPDAIVNIAGKNVYIKSETKNALYVNNNSAINIFGDSTIIADNKGHINKNALYVTMPFSYVPGQGFTVKSKEGYIRLLNGNHTIVGNIRADDGGQIYIAEGTHSIYAPHIFAVGHTEYDTNNDGNSEKISSSVSIDFASGSEITAHVDDFLFADKKIIDREIESSQLSFTESQGKVSFTMAENSKWNVLGKSFITDLVLDNGAEVNLAHDITFSNNIRDGLGRGLVISNLSSCTEQGGMFTLYLNGTDKSKSDMLYIVNDSPTSLAEQELRKPKYTANIVAGSDLSILHQGDIVRFATVKTEEQAKAFGDYAVVKG